MTELEEKLEVALVQIEIYRAIQEMKMDEREEKEWLGRLEEKLFTISEVSTYIHHEALARGLADLNC